MAAHIARLARLGRQELAAGRTHGGMSGLPQAGAPNRQGGDMNAARRPYGRSAGFHPRSIGLYAPLCLATSKLTWRSLPSR